MSKNRKTNNYHQPNLWGMIQNVLIASIKKGQFLMGILGIIAIIMVAKLSPEDTKDLIDQMLSVFKNIYYVGWPLFFVVILAWYWTSKRTRRIHAVEMDRIAAEKKRLQERLHNKRLGTTKR